MSTAVSMRDMLEAGVHFGHQQGRWNPKMRPFIWGAKSGIHIINLQKTARLHQKATNFVQRLAQRGDQLLFIGTKRQAQEVVSEEAERCKQPFVNHRWLGGMLTNFRTIKGSLERIEEIEKQLDVGNVERLTKKEVIRLERERNKLLKNLGGIREMPRLPGAVFIVDTIKEHLAVKEARKLDIPIVALVDTNSDPDEVDFPIPSNDDAIRAIKLFTRSISDAYVSGAAMHKETFMREHAGAAAAQAPVDVVVRKAEPEGEEKAEAAEEKAEATEKKPEAAGKPAEAASKGDAKTEEE